MAYEGKQRRLFACCAAVLLLGAPPMLAAAQEALPGTPKGLEDFRLDTPPPKAKEVEPQPAPAEPVAQPRPGVEQPPANPEIETPAPAPSRQSPPARIAPVSGQQDTPSQQAPTTIVGNDASTIEPAAPAGEELAPAAAASGNESARPPDNASEPAGSISPVSSISPLWLFLAVLAALAFAFFAFRRFSQPARAEIAAARPPEPTIDEGDPHAIAVKEAELPEPAEAKISHAAASQRARAAKPPALPELEMRFEPDEVILGFAALTLRGELKIANIGKAMASNVRLRTAAITANARQQQMIAAFNRGESGPTEEPIDNIRKGERLNISIEVSLPRAELASYSVQGREICVPIILADLEWSGLAENSEKHLRIAAMLGRETNPPQDKMAPFRIDLGPRSFSEVAQRSIAA